MAVATTSPLRGPRGHVLFGNLAELRRDWLGTLTRYARDYGDFVPFRIGLRQGVLLSHPDLVEAVLVAHARHVIKSPILRTGRRLLGNGLLLSEGDLWRRQRRLVQPAFQRRRIEGYGPAMLAATERLLARWADGQPRELHAEMMRLTLEIAAETLFGVDVSAEAGRVGAAMIVAVERFNRRMNSPVLFMLPDTLPLPGNFTFLRAAARLDRLVYRMIEQRRRAGAVARDDVLSLLLRARDEDGSRMTDRQLRDEVMTLFLAGHETTAIALAWTCYLLALHPEVERTLLAELRAALGGRPPSVADLPRLAYTANVVAEALRLYPPAWALARETIRPIEVGGRVVPRGAICLTSPWVIQRDPRCFARPEVFDPGRWSDGLARRLPKFAYFPFGGGPRLCIGHTFALQELALVLAAVAQRCRLELLPDQTVTPWPSVTLRPKEGIRAIPRPRRDEPLASG